ncbi:MAG: YicC/YloC family endoribonuclease [Nitrospirales bacterium]
MTGYGRRESAWSGGAVAVEIRSVNHRFCDVVVRLPRALSSLEEAVKRDIQEKCARGRIDVTVLVSGVPETEKILRLDQGLARQYHRLLTQLKRELKLGGTIDVALLAGFRDLLTAVDRPVQDPRMGPLVQRLVKGALDDVEAMRRREGAALARDVQQHLSLIRQTCAQVERRAPAVVQAHFDTMRARLDTLLGATSVDEGRLQQELAVFAVRCDISEELARLASHVNQFAATLKKKEPLGKTLDFLLQEMGREVNTIGSKANDAEVATHVVQMKSELEKIREQVQNIE